MNTETIKAKLADIRKRMASAAVSCGRDPLSVKLVVVSKTRSPDEIREAARAGASLFGENYVKEATEKIRLLSDLYAPFHLIGHLQSNKAKIAVQLFDLIHSVDSASLAVALDKQAKKIGKIQKILVQVNTGMEQSKSGIDEAGLESLVRTIHGLENIKVMGLMTIPPFDADPETVRPFFKSLRLAAERIKALGLPNIVMDELSMGMTGDFETAIEEGATFVRIGTAIFGERP
jgi:pyridoxal phosphate enzyme (YggS family)